MTTGYLIDSSWYDEEDEQARPLGARASRADGTDAGQHRVPPSEEPDDDTAQRFDLSGSGRGHPPGVSLPAEHPLRRALEDQTYPCPGYHCAHGAESMFADCPGAPETEEYVAWSCPTWKQDCPTRLTIYEEWDGDGEYKSWTYPVARGPDEMHEGLVERLNESDYEGDFWGAVFERRRLEKLLDPPGARGAGR